MDGPGDFCGGDQQGSAAGRAEIQGLPLRREGVFEAQQASGGFIGPFAQEAGQGARGACCGEGKPWDIARAGVGDGMGDEGVHGAIGRIWRVPHQIERPFLRAIVQRDEGGDAARKARDIDALRGKIGRIALPHGKAAFAAVTLPKAGDGGQFGGTFWGQVVDLDANRIGLAQFAAQGGVGGAVGGEGLGDEDGLGPQCGDVPADAAGHGGGAGAGFVNGGKAGFGLGLQDQVLQGGGTDGVKQGGQGMGRAAQQPCTTRAFGEGQVALTDEGQFRARRSGEEGFGARWTGWVQGECCAKGSAGGAIGGNCSTDQGGQHERDDAPAKDGGEEGGVRGMGEEGEERHLEHANTTRGTRDKARAKGEQEGGQQGDEGDVDGQKQPEGECGAEGVNNGQAEDARQGEKVGQVEAL